MIKQITKGVRALGALILLPATMLLPGTLSAQKAPGYVITAALDGLKDGEKIRMTVNRKRYDSAIVRDGKFLLKGNIPDGPGDVEINLGYGVADVTQGDMFLHLLMDNEAIVIHGSIRAGKKLAETVVIENARIDSDKKALVKIFENWRERSKHPYERGALDMDSLLRYREVIPYVFMSCYWYAGRETLFPGLYQQLDDKGKSSYYGKLMKEKLFLCKGQSAPAFVSVTPAGKKLSLGSVVARNKLTIIDFWASYCSICVNEFKTTVIPLYGEYHDKGLEILGVSCDEKAEAWKKAISGQGLPWLQVSSLKGLDKMRFHDPVFLLYKVPSTPTNVLIDHEGKIIAWNVYGSELHWYVDKILNDGKTSRL